MFDGTLYKYKGSDYSTELLENAKYYHAKPFLMPIIYKLFLKKEVDILIKIGVLKKSCNSQWCSKIYL